MAKQFVAVQLLTNAWRDKLVGLVSQSASVNGMLTKLVNCKIEIMRH